MNCNCAKSCSIPSCITSLEIGIIEPGLTDLIVQFTEITTGRIKMVTGVSPQADGLLIVDVEDINAFFSPNFSYELTVLFSDESACQSVPVNIGGEVVSCVEVSFTDSGVSTAGIIVLYNQVSQYLSLTGSFSSDLFFTLTFGSGNFIVYWGDGQANVVTSNLLILHTYVSPGVYSARIRGDFSSLSGLSTGNAGTDLTSAVLPSVNAITNLVLRSNSLTSSVVDTLLVNMNNGGLTNGIVSLQNQSPSAPPGSLGNLAIADLAGKGWTVTTD